MLQGKLTFILLTCLSFFRRNFRDKIPSSHTKNKPTRLHPE